MEDLNVSSHGFHHPFCGGVACELECLVAGRRRPPVVHDHHGHRHRSHMWRGCFPGANSSLGQLGICSRFSTAARGLQPVSDPDLPQWRSRPDLSYLPGLFADARFDRGHAVCRGTARCGQPAGRGADLRQHPLAGLSGKTDVNGHPALRSGHGLLHRRLQCRRWHGRTTFGDTPQLHGLDVLAVGRADAACLHVAA